MLLGKQLMLLWKVGGIKRFLFLIGESVKKLEKLHKATMQGAPVPF